MYLGSGLIAEAVRNYAQKANVVTFSGAREAKARMSRRTIEVLLAVTFSLVTIGAGTLLRSARGDVVSPRIDEAGTIAKAIEAYLALPGNDRLQGGYNDGGSGWFANETDAYYRRSIREELVSVGVLGIEDAADRYDFDYAIYPCAGRYGVFAPARSDAAVSVQALKWWEDNGCVEGPVQLYTRFALGSPHLELVIIPVEAGP